MHKQSLAMLHNITDIQDNQRCKREVGLSKIHCFMEPNTAYQAVMPPCGGFMSHSARLDYILYISEALSTQVSYLNKQTTGEMVC